MTGTEDADVPADARAPIARHTAMLAAVAGISRRLLAADRWQDEVPSVLAELGAASGAARVALTRHVVVDGVETPTLHDEWCADHLDGDALRVARDTTASATAPVTVDGGPWGRLDVVHPEPTDRSTRPEVDAIATVAAALAAAIERADARLVRRALELTNDQLEVRIAELDRAERSLRLLERTANAANAAADPAGALRAVLEDICTTVGSDVGQLFRVVGDTIVTTDTGFVADPALTPLVPTAQGTTTAPAAPVARRVVADGRAIWIEDVDADPSTAALVRSGIGSVVAVPVAIGAEIVAVLTFLTTAPRACDLRLLETLERVGAQLGWVFERDRYLADLRRSNAELEQFAYVASHDLQEPLRKVASYCQLLERRYAGRLDDDADEFIGYAVDGAKRMQQLINDLLTYSRVGRADVPLVPTGLEAVAHRAVRGLEFALSDAGATVDIGSLPPVIGDAGQLEQVLANLVSNAVKFVRDRPPRIVIAAQREPGVVHVTVADNGIGIAPEHRERIFGIFQRLHARAEYPGTGIGLALCQRIVDRHGGRIWIESEPGEGTTVHVTLPASDEPSAA